MCQTRIFRTRVIAAAAAAMLCPDTWADDAPLATVVVTGKRASMMSAQELKRDSLDIVDGVLADDIHKLPDTSVTDALQRITGVQIARDRGEGTAVAIRGLTQMENTLNGREVFTAGTGRNIDFADIPSEMVSRIDVFKTASAERIEGGVGGTIDLRTRRPLDFKGREIVASARALHGDLVKGTQPQFSLLASERWQGTDGGQFGILLNLVHQKRGWREDQKSVGAPTARSNIIAGSTVIAPTNSSETTSLGQRERDAANLALQWRPSSALELYADASYARFRTRQDSYQINLSASPTFAAGSAVLFPGTNDIQSITWTNAPLSILSFARDVADQTRQAGLGGAWHAGPWSVKADLSRTTSTNDFFFSGPFMAATVASFSQDLSTRVPGSSIAGTSLLDPANLRFTGLGYRTRPFDGALTTARADAEYRLAGDFFETVAAGVRQARRSAANAPGLIFADAALPGTPPASQPGATIANPFGADFFPGSGVSSVSNYLVGNLAGARDAPALRAAFGVNAAIPGSASALTLWDIGETTRSAYLNTSFKGGRLDGNAGVRMVRTRETVSGSRTAPTGGAPVPIAIDSSYTDYLPSMNLRYGLADGLYLRAAASKTITRPNFDQLSPSLSLVSNPLTPSANAGSAGNPDLKPVRSDNLDLAIEKYVKAGTAFTATAFLKHVDGFVTNTSAPETYEGLTYQITRPHNTTGARIKGFELGYQQFFDFLPGALRGLGMQANYTYVDSSMPHSALGSVPLQNLSKNSTNLIAIYENAQLSARLAYNWRSKFLSGFTTVVGVGVLPVYTRGYGWLDGSLSYRVSPRMTLAFEGNNLLRTVRSAYYGVETRPQSAWLNDRQFSVSMTLRY